MTAFQITVPITIEITEKELRRLRRGKTIDLGTAHLGSFCLTSYDGEPITPSPTKRRKAPKVKPLKNGTRTERL